MASVSLSLGVVGAPSYKGTSRGALSLSAPKLKSPTLVFPALQPFRPPSPTPLPAAHPLLQEALTLIRAAWTRRASGQPPARKNKKSWGQRVDKYMKPFMLDINISRRYLSCKVVHRVTGKAVSVATTNARDLRNSLPSLIDANACKTVGKLLAERTKAADVFAVTYEPRRHEKLEGRLALILDTILANDIVLV
eukprot:c3252_g1_i1 orf=92-673(+)